MAFRHIALQKISACRGLLTLAFGSPWRAAQEEFDDVLCSISGQVMQDPVIGEDKLTYDRAWLRPIYYQLSGTFPDLKLGTYPLTRHPMKINPDELPRDEVRYQKIQSLIQRYQVPQQPLAPSKPAEEDALSTLQMAM